MLAVYLRPRLSVTGARGNQNPLLYAYEAYLFGDHYSNIISACERLLVNLATTKGEGLGLIFIILAHARLFCLTENGA